MLKKDRLLIAKLLLLPVTTWFLVILFFGIILGGRRSDTYLLASMFTLTVLAYYIYLLTGRLIEYGVKLFSLEDPPKNEEHQE